MVISQAIIYYVPVEKKQRKFIYAFSNNHYSLAIFYASIRMKTVRADSSNKYRFYFSISNIKMCVQHSYFEFYLILFDFQWFPHNSKLVAMVGKMNDKMQWHAANFLFVFLHFDDWSSKLWEKDETQQIKLSLTLPLLWAYQKSNGKSSAEEGTEKICLFMCREDMKNGLNAVCWSSKNPN